MQKSLKEWRVAANHSSGKRYFSSSYTLIDVEHAIKCVLLTSAKISAAYVLPDGNFNHIVSGAVAVCQCSGCYHYHVTTGPSDTQQRRLLWLTARTFSGAQSGHCWPAIYYNIDELVCSDCNVRWVC